MGVFFLFFSLEKIPIEKIPKTSKKQNNLDLKRTQVLKVFNNI